MDTACVCGEKGDTWCDKCQSAFHPLCAGYAKNHFIENPNEKAKCRKCRSETDIITKSQSQAITAIKTRIQETGLTSQSSVLPDVAKEHKFYVIGVTEAGKTTLMNAMTGIKVPTPQFPTKHMRREHHDTKQWELELQFHDERKAEVFTESSLKKFNKYLKAHPAFTDKTSADYRDLELAIVRGPLPVAATFAEPMGLACHANSGNQEITENLLQEILCEDSDSTILLVVSGSRVESGVGELFKICDEQSVMRDLLGKVVFVLTKSADNSDTHDTECSNCDTEFPSIKRSCPECGAEQSYDDWQESCATILEKEKKYMKTSKDDVRGKVRKKLGEIYGEDLSAERKSALDFMADGIPVAFTSALEERRSQLLEDSAYKVARLNELLSLIVEVNGPATRLLQSELRHLAYAEGEDRYPAQIETTTEQVWKLVLEHQFKECKLELDIMKEKTSNSWQSLKQYLSKFTHPQTLQNLILEVANSSDLKSMRDIAKDLLAFMVNAPTLIGEASAGPNWLHSVCLPWNMFVKYVKRVFIPRLKIKYHLEFTDLQQLVTQMVNGYQEPLQKCIQTFFTQHVVEKLSLSSTRDGKVKDIVNECTNKHLGKKMVDALVKYMEDFLEQVCKKAKQEYDKKHSDMKNEEAKLLLALSSYPSERNQKSVANMCQAYRGKLDLDPGVQNRLKLLAPTETKLVLLDRKVQRSADGEIKWEACLTAMDVLVEGVSIDHKDFLKKHSWLEGVVDEESNIMYDSVRGSQFILLFLYAVDERVGQARNKFHLLEDVYEQLGMRSQQLLEDFKTANDLLKKNSRREGTRKSKRKRKKTASKSDAPGSPLEKKARLDNEEQADETEGLRRSGRAKNTQLQCCPGRFRKHNPNCPHSRSSSGRES